MADGMVALVLNRSKDRLKETGVVIVSKATERILFTGQNPLSRRLAADYQRPGEYHTETIEGTKNTLFWLPNKLKNFSESAPGYYRYGGYDLLLQDLHFEPSLDHPIHLTETFFVTDENGYEQVNLT